MAALHAALEEPTDKRAPLARAAPEILRPANADFCVNAAEANLAHAEDLLAERRTSGPAR